MPQPSVPAPQPQALPHERAAADCTSRGAPGTPDLVPNGTPSCPFWNKSIAPVTFNIKDNQQIRARTHPSSSSEQVQLEGVTHYLDIPLRQPSTHDKPKAQARRSSSRSRRMIPMRIIMIIQLPPVSENQIISIRGSDSAPEGPRPIQPVSLDAKQGRRDPRFGEPRANQQVLHHAVRNPCPRR